MGFLVHAVRPKHTTSEALKGRRIALAEAREVDLFAGMLERAGAETVRCPFVAIFDAPDPAPVEAWIDRIIADRFNDLILYTGETDVGSESGFVLVSHSDLLATINGEKINEEIQSAASAGYESPYLRFAREASQKLGLKEAEKVPKDHITTWLRKNWPRELGPCSNRKIDAMATFLRRPEDEKGGHFRKDEKTKGDTH